MRSLGVRSCTDPGGDPLAAEVVAETLLDLPHEDVSVLLLKRVVGRVKQTLCVLSLDALTRQLGRSVQQINAAD